MAVDFQFLMESFGALLRGVPLTIQLTLLSVTTGAMLAMALALMRVSGKWWLDGPARVYVFVFRGTPLLVQLYIIYYGLSQFPLLRHSVLWPVLREAYWCSALALALNTAAYSAEIIRGGLLSVSLGQVEAARSFGMSGILLFRRIIMPLALRQMLPGYSNEIILMVKSTALASTVTLLEITGIAAKLISQSYRPIEVFVCAGAIYLAINFAVSRLFAWLERAMSPERRSVPLAVLPNTMRGEHRV